MRNDELAARGEESTIDYPGSHQRGPMKIRVRCDGLTDRGRVRENNEDNFLIARMVKAMHLCRSSLSEQGRRLVSEEIAHLLVVADGLGGAAAGETASSLAIETVEDFVLNTFKWFLQFAPGEDDASHKELQKELSQALERADHEVFRRARAERDLAGMGTTITLAYTVGDELYVAHAGDSRAYLLRDGELTQLTTDHTYAQMLQQTGAITPEAARKHRLRNVVTNVVGGPDEGVHAEIHKAALEDGDVLLLCTDGVTEPLEDAEIAGAIGAADDPSAACDELLDRALKAGGPDNIALVVARFDIRRG